MTVSRLALSVGAAAVLGACTLGPDYRPRSAEQLGMPAAWSVPANLSAREDLTQWWTRFDDPLLQRLVASAATENLDVGQAVTRLRQAREALIQSRADLFPRLSGSAGYNRSLNIVGGTSQVVLPDGTVTTITRGNSGSFSLGGSVQYQAGIFGEFRRTIEGTRAQYEASGYDYAAVLISTQAEIARNYMLARLAQAQLANARGSLSLQDDNLEIAGFRVDAGLVSSLDREQARSQRAQTAATIPQLEVSYNQAVSRLGVLTGQAPGALKTEMAAVRPIPAGTPGVATGIPADVLRQRPDVLAAERNLAAATAQIGVAQAELYPALAISGNINTNAAGLGGLFDTVTGSLFAGLTQLIFDGGRARAQVRSARAAADGALLAYRGTVLVALEDVENALAALDGARAREREFTTALDAADATALLARLQYRSGLTDFITLNQSETALLSARNGLSQARADAANATVQLYLALGGGWSAADSAPTIDTVPAPATLSPQDR